MLNRNSYGWRRMLMTLNQEGIVCNHKKVRRLMKELHLVPKVKKKFKATTNSNHGLPVEPNPLKESFMLLGPTLLGLVILHISLQMKAGSTWQQSLTFALAKLKDGP